MPCYASFFIRMEPGSTLNIPPEWDLRQFLSRHIVPLFPIPLKQKGLRSYSDFGATKFLYFCLASYACANRSLFSDVNTDSEICWGVENWRWCRRGCVEGLGWDVPSCLVGVLVDIPKFKRGTECSWFELRLLTMLSRSLSRLSCWVKAEGCGCPGGCNKGRGPLCGDRNANGVVVPGAPPPLECPCRACTRRKEATLFDNVVLVSEA